MLNYKTNLPLPHTAIKNALRQQNLNPEIEEKLLNLQRYQEQQLKDGADAPFTYTPITTSAATSHRKRVIRRQHDDDDDDLDDELDDGAIPEDDDDEDWFANKRRRKPYVPKTDRKSIVPRTSSTFTKPRHDEQQGPQQQRQPPARLVSVHNVQKHSIGGGGNPVQVPLKAQSQLVSIKPKQTIVTQAGSVTTPAATKVMQVVNQNTAPSKADLSEKLANHRDMLRDSMLKKRETLEEELKKEIRQELDSTLEEIQGSGGEEDEAKTVANQENEVHSSNNKYSSRKRTSSGAASKRGGDGHASAEETSGRSAKMHHSSKSSHTGSTKKSNRSQGASESPSSSAAKKKEQLYCICQTPYDDSK